MADFNTAPDGRTRTALPYTPDGPEYAYSDYSFDPGHVGRWVENFDYSNPEYPRSAGFSFIPSKFDFTGAKQDTGVGFQNKPPGDYDANNLKTYVMPDGSAVQYDPASDSIVQMNLPVSAYAGTSRTATDLNGNVYALPETSNFDWMQGPSGFKSFQGQKDIFVAQDPYIYNPNTKQVVQGPSGQTYTPQITSSGGFDDWITENGWMVPAAMIAAGAGSAAFGGEAAAGAAGGELAGPTYAELGYTGVEGGLAGPTYAELGYTGLNNAEAIAAADAAAKGLTGAEALKYVNQARQGLGLASTLSKLLSGGASGKTGTAGGGLDLSKLASLLGGGGQQTNSFIGQIKGNQNPFLFTPPGQTPAAEGTYDVSGSNLANALRKK